jgi:hypothetical protein
MLAALMVMLASLSVSAEIVILPFLTSSTGIYLVILLSRKKGTMLWDD